MSTLQPYWWHTIHRGPRSSSDHPCFRLNPCTQPEPLNDKTVQKRLAALSCSLSVSQRRIHFFIMGSTNIPESCVCSCLTVSKVLPGYRDRINLKHGAVVMLPYLLCIKQGDLQLYFNSVPGKAAENKSKAFQVWYSTCKHTALWADEVHTDILELSPSNPDSLQPPDFTSRGRRTEQAWCI